MYDLLVKMNTFSCLHFFVCKQSSPFYFAFQLCEGVLLCVCAEGDENTRLVCFGHDSCHETELED